MCPTLHHLAPHRNQPRPTSAPPLHPFPSLSFPPFTRPDLPVRFHPASAYTEKPTRSSSPPAVSNLEERLSDSEGAVAGRLPAGLLPHLEFHGDVSDGVAARFRVVIQRQSRLKSLGREPVQ